MRSTSLPTLLAIAIAASQLGATECGVIIDDAGFDHWCGDQLCYWTLEKGGIEKVPTWHAGDDGVALVGDEVAISQLTEVASYDTDCIRFEMIANVAEDAEVHLEADVFGDGTVDWSERIPTTPWRKVTLRIGLAGSYEGVRFRLTKVGPGEAVFGRIHAEVAEEGEVCPSYVDVTERPIGATCLADEDCADDRCHPGFWGGICSTCIDNLDCAEGSVCGREPDPAGNLASSWACVVVQSRALGEPCFYDAECATGACNGALCSECHAGDTCDGGETCVPSEDVPVDRCGPVAGDRASGAPCVVDGDCASGACEGTPLGVCDQPGVPRACFEDDDCLRDQLAPAACTLVAVAGGTCQ